MRRQQPRRPGNVTILTMFSLTALVGFTAVAIDGGMLLDYNRRVRAAADAAALAGAAELFANYRLQSGLDTGGTAAAKAKNTATKNGFPNCTVNIPPKSGAFSGKAGYVEVIITHNMKRGFSAIWGSGTMPVTVRSVARGSWEAFKNGVLVLDPKSGKAVTNTGGGNIKIEGVPFLVNSSASDAIWNTGGAITSAPDIYIGGNPGYAGSGTLIGNVHSNALPTPDPLRYLPEPDPTTLPTQSVKAYRENSGKRVTLDPGVYIGGINFSGKGKLKLNPGIYYMQGGGFSWTGQAGLEADGVMIVNAPESNADRINVDGQGAVVMNPITTGIYKGISLWQQRSSDNVVQVTGNGEATMSGTFYAAGGTLKITGNGTTDILGAQYISWQLTTNGNGTFSVVWDADKTAKSRLIGLVE